jgi:pimeloyl-ACP methyl ester carboxylesterase
MIRPLTLAFLRSAVLLWAHTLLPSSGLSQAIDTVRVRAVFDAVTELRSEYEETHGRFADVNGIRLHYLEWGEVGGVPLVWAHGSASTAYEIRAVAPQLAEAGYRVLAVDYRGHGLTRVADYEFSIYHVADDLVALLDHLQIRAAVFGGASKGGFVAAAVYDQYPDRVLGLLMADGGTWSNQWVFDHSEPEEVRRRIERTDMPPQISGASEFDVFLQMAGPQVSATDDPPIELLLDLLVRIGPVGDDEWAFLPGFDQMMGLAQRYSAGTKRPTTLPLLQWSQHAMNPLVVFRRLDVPMMIIDPQEENDDLPVTDQNERLARLHPSLVTHRVYAQTGHAVVRQKPEWFVRDAVALLDQVRRRAP